MVSYHLIFIKPVEKCHITIVWGNRYPGKYLPFRESSSVVKEEAGPTQQETELTARIKEEERMTVSGDIRDEQKKEMLICSTVRAVRGKFLERRIIGKIYICRMRYFLDISCYT